MIDERLSQEVKDAITALLGQDRIEEAIPLMKQLANWGDLESQKELTRLFLAEGRDLKSAYAYCRLAAMNRDPEAMVDFARMNQQGIGCSKDLSKAFYFYSRAAELEEPKAYDPLSMMYLTGQGTQRDLKEARSYNERARQAFGDEEVLLRHLKMIEKMEEKNRF